MCEPCLKFVIFTNHICDTNFLLNMAGMGSYPLLNPAVDSKHRAKIWEAGSQPNVLRTRTPASNWMIHPDWVERYVPLGVIVLIIFTHRICPRTAR